jgi:hypothetical protein
MRTQICWNQIREVATSLFSNNISKVYTASKFQKSLWIYSALNLKKIILHD